MKLHTRSSIFCDIFRCHTKKGYSARFRNWNVAYAYERIFLLLSHTFDPPPACVCEADENSRHSTHFQCWWKIANTHTNAWTYSCGCTLYTHVNMRKAACWKCILCHLSHELHERKSKFNIPLCVYKRFEHKFIHLLEHYAVYIAATATTPLENN